MQYKIVGKSKHGMINCNINLFGCQNVQWKYCENVQCTRYIWQEVCTKAGLNALNGLKWTVWISSNFINSSEYDAITFNKCKCTMKGTYNKAF